MATKAKSTSSSCLSFVKDALLLPTRDAKLFVPALLLAAIPTFLLQTTYVSNTQSLSLATGILLHISVMVFALVCSLANQVAACFAASTAYSGDRYSPSEFLSKVIMKGRRLSGALVTIAIAAAFSNVPLILLQQVVVRHLGALYVAALELPFRYLDVVFVVATAVSVADTQRRGGVSALRQAWRLITRVRRKEGCVLAVVVNLLAKVPSLLYGVALGYSEKSMPVGLALLAVDALLSGLVELLCLAAAMVYYYQAMESKKVTAHDYV